MEELHKTIYFKANLYKNEYDHIYFCGDLWLDIKNKSYGEICNGISITKSFNYQKKYYKKTKQKKL
jgi:hypothetical protein